MFLTDFLSTTSRKFYQKSTEGFRKKIKNKMFIFFPSVQDVKEVFIQNKIILAEIIFDNLFTFINFHFHIFSLISQTCLKIHYMYYS
jgi:hypothetical protein